MPEETFKPLTVESIGLTPEEIRDLVKGAQKYLKPEDEDGEPIETSSK